MRCTRCNACIVSEPHVHVRFRIGRAASGVPCERRIMTALPLDPAHASRPLRRWRGSTWLGSAEDDSAAVGADCISGTIASDTGTKARAPHRFIVLARQGGIYGDEDERFV